MISEGDFVKINYFLRSDNPKSLSFFKEFGQFYSKIGIDKIQFNPVYKYSESYYYDETERPKVCVFDKYCGAENSQFKIAAAELVLNENIRQKCIHWTYYTDKTRYFDTYWKYMIDFQEACLDEVFPNFTPECSEKVVIYY